MVVLNVVKKHMVANEREPMVLRALLFTNEVEARAWMLAHPVDVFTRVGNVYQYELTELEVIPR